MIYSFLLAVIFFIKNAWINPSFRQNVGGKVSKMVFAYCAVIETKKKIKLFFYINTLIFNINKLSKIPHDYFIYWNDFISLNFVI